MPDLALPRVAWFTPLRPIRSGISLYNEELLPALRGVVEIDVFVDGYRPVGIEGGAGLRLLPARRFDAEDRRRRYDAIVYQMGNSPAHAYMVELALRRPGILVLHDTVLHHLVLSMTTVRGVRRYRVVMSERYGERGAEMAERVLRGQMPAEMFDFPLSEDLIESARFVVTHSEFSRGVVESLGARAAVRVPMGIRLPQPIAVDVARAALRLPSEPFTVASVTLVNPYKRLDVVLRALRRLGQDRAVRFVIAGDVSPAVPLARLVSLNGLDDVVTLRGYVDVREAALLAAAADVTVNLRYPTAGETSSSLLRLMAAGRPVLVSDAGSFRELPDWAVVKVPVDALEEETVLALLGALAKDPRLAEQIGRSARRFVEDEHSVTRMAEGYRAVLQEATGGTLPPVQVDEATCAIDTSAPQAPASNALLDAVASGIAGLGLAANDDLARSAARAVIDLGLGPGNISRVDEERRGEGGRA
jgi:glycosyltransferase involved in cell wall biosynthesis